MRTSKRIAVNHSAAMDSKCVIFSGMGYAWPSGMFTTHGIADARTPEPPLVVHLTRAAGLLTLLGGVIMLIAGMWALASRSFS
jgi:hypothetical protein